MSEHHITVHQLNSRGGAFLNVDCEQGRVMVWTHAWKHPTLLLRNGDVVMLVQFDDEAWMKEWLAENGRAYLTIEHLDDVHKRPEALAADQEEQG